MKLENETRKYRWVRTTITILYTYTPPVLLSIFILLKLGIVGVSQLLSDTFSDSNSVIKVVFIADIIGLLIGTYAVLDGYTRYPYWAEKPRISEFVFKDDCAPDGW